MKLVMIRYLLLLFYISFTLSGCTVSPPIKEGPCDYVNGLTEEASTLLIPRIESLRRNYSQTLTEVINCLGEPDYYTAQVGGGNGWSYTLELFYPQKGIAITGRTENYISDQLDKNGHPIWKTENPQFNTPEEVVPRLLFVRSITLTEPTTTFEELKPMLVEASSEGYREQLLSRVFPWEGWNNIIVLEKLEIMAK